MPEINGSMTVVLRPFIPCLFLSLTTLTSCETPGDQLARLQHQLLTILQHREYFEFQAGKQIFRWPLPPSEAVAAKNRLKIQEIQQELQAIDLTDLPATQREAIVLFQQTIEEVAARGGGGVFDPLQCVVYQQLEESLKDPAMAKATMQQVAAYYQEVENRWQTPALARAIQAANESVQTFHWLENQQAPEAALLAVKDFMAHCRSVVLN